ESNEHCALIADGAACLPRCPSRRTDCEPRSNGIFLVWLHRHCRERLGASRVSSHSLGLARLRSTVLFPGSWRETILDCGCGFGSRDAGSLRGVAYRGTPCALS